MRPAGAGYTLIELLIVIAIIALLSIVGFVNFKNFSANQVAVKTAGEVQTLLRLAQSNATSSTLCNNQGNNQGATFWSVKFISNNTMELRCDPGDILVRNYTLEPNITLSFSCSGCSFSFPTIFKYQVGSGALTISPTSLAVDSSAAITVTVTNTKPDPDITSSFNLSKGGAINVQ